MALKLIKWSLNTRLYSTISTNANLIEKLSKISASKYLGNIDELLNNAPELTRYSPDQWENAIENLKDVGFDASKFAYMIAQNPKLISKPKDKIKETMNNWFFFDFGKKETYQLIERYPELLEVKQFDKIHENLNVVKSLVGGKHGYQIIRNSPNIVTDTRKSLEEKVDYLRDVMNVDPVEVYKSNVFSLDLITLKTRHIFLERLGMWFKKKKPRKGENNDAHEAKKNMKLSKLSDSSDKRFATKICHVTFEEYETFTALYREELENNEDKFKRRKKFSYSDNDLDDEDEDDNESDHREIDYNK